MKNDTNVHTEHGNEKPPSEQGQDTCAGGGLFGEYITQAKKCFAEKSTHAADKQIILF